MLDNSLAARPTSGDKSDWGRGNSSPNTFEPLIQDLENLLAAFARAADAGLNRQALVDRAGRINQPKVHISQMKADRGEVYFSSRASCIRAAPYELYKIFKFFPT